MELDMIKRGLRAEINKRQKETYATCQTNVRDMCTDVLSKLEEQEKEIAELKAELKAIVITDNSAVIARLEDDLRKTQRALWMARSRRAFAEARYNNQIARRYEDRNEKTIAECYDKEVAKWKNSDRKCRAKAEQYL